MPQRPCVDRQCRAELQLWCFNAVPGQMYKGESFWHSWEQRRFFLKHDITLFILITLPFVKHSHGDMWHANAQEEKGNVSHSRGLCHFGSATAHRDWRFTSFMFSQVHQKKYYAGEGLWQEWSLFSLTGQANTPERVPDKPEAAVPLHSHTDILLLYVTKGARVYSNSRKHFSLQPSTYMIKGHRWDDANSTVMVQTTHR